MLGKRKRCQICSGANGHRDGGQCKCVAFGNAAAEMTQNGWDGNFDGTDISARPA